MLLAASLPAFLAPWIGRRMVALIPDVDPEAAYFTTLEPMLLYFLMPVAVLGSLFLVMAPGLLLVRALGRGKDLWTWLLEGFVFSLFAVSLTAAVTQEIMGQPLMGISFVAVTYGLLVVCSLVYLARAGIVSKQFGAEDRRRSPGLVLLGVLSVALVVVLTPKFFWEALNGDGAHSFEATRLLMHQSFPFWQPEAGVVSSWPGANGLTVAYPASWFMRMFGENEASVRLVYLLYFSLLIAGVVAIAEAGRKRVLNIGQLMLVSGSILCFSVVMAYSATYDPYCADISMPGTHDALNMIFLFGAIASLARREMIWALCWTVLALLTSPAALLVIVAMILGVLVSRRPFAWRLCFRHMMGLIAALVIIAMLVQVFKAVGGLEAGEEHGSLGMLKRYKVLALLDMDKFLWALLPCGIYPLICFFFWRTSDQLCRSLMIATGITFLAYYVMARVSIHYFVPTMLLPLAAYWRQEHRVNQNAGLLWFSAFLIGFTTWLAAPTGSGIYVASRQIGQSIDVSGLPGYEEMKPSVFRGAEMLTRLFRKSSAAKGSLVGYRGSPLSWLHYAHDEGAQNVEKNYELVSEDSVRSSQGIKVAEEGGFALYVYNRRKWMKDKSMPVSHSRGGSVFQVPLQILFYSRESKRLGLFRVPVPKSLKNVLKK